jgi:monoamine oxidase
MAPHAKYLAVYPHAFWRERGLSGAARSASGPLAEIHDASTLEGAAALFGFIGVPADMRARIGEPALLAACRAQLVRLFGSEARDPHFEIIKDWTASSLTATAADRSASAHHGHAPRSVASAGLWRERLAGIGSEWSARYPGYVAGAIDAVDAAIESIFLERGAPS